jgi:hypothetical protein
LVRDLWKDQRFGGYQGSVLTDDGARVRGTFLDRVSASGRSITFGWMTYAVRACRNADITISYRYTHGKLKVVRHASPCT